VNIHFRASYPCKSIILLCRVACLKWAFSQTSREWCCHSSLCMLWRSFIQQIFIELWLNVRLCSKHRGYNNKQNKIPCHYIMYIVPVRGKNELVSYYVRFFVSNSCKKRSRYISRSSGHLFFFWMSGFRNCTHMPIGGNCGYTAYAVWKQIVVGVFHCICKLLWHLCRSLNCSHL